MTAARTLLIVGGGASLTAAAAHLACIAGGPDWYRAMGAPEGYARAAGRGAWTPAIVTAAIAAMLSMAAAYAFSGAGVIGRMPLLRAGLVVITAIYLARGLMLFTPAALRRPDLSPGFILWSSVIVLGMGAVHAFGIWRNWKYL